MRGYVTFFACFMAVAIIFRSLRLMREKYPIKEETTMRQEVAGLIVQAVVFIWGMYVLR